MYVNSIILIAAGSLGELLQIKLKVKLVSFAIYICSHIHVLRISSIAQHLC
jgi:hypothetical protein